MREGTLDRQLLVAVIALVGISVVMVYSSSSVVAYTTYGDAAYFMKRQVAWACLGFLALLAMSRLDHRFLARKQWVLALLIVSILLLAATLVPGIGKTINGSRRWLRLGVFTFQAAELAKYALVLYLGYFISMRGDRMRDFADGMVPPLLITGLFAALVLLQPDFGSAMTMAFAMAVMLYAGGARLAHLGGLAAASIPLIVLAVLWSPYRMRRIFAYLDPWADPQGAGYQIIQSFYALGSGGLLGRGLGEGRQKLLFLPERHSDFIYAVIGEELGLWGTLLVLGLFAVILWRGIAVARSAHEPFSRHLALGITLLICGQGAFNMAVVTGLMPTKGIALPLVSYGGSSLVVTLAAAGVLLNISKGAEST